MKKGKTNPVSKVCTVCGTNKPIDDFRTHKTRGFNLNQCRQCESDMAKKRREDKRVMTVTATVIKKVCKKCGKEKPIDDFRTHKNGSNLNQCRQCERDSAKKRNDDKRSKTAIDPSPFYSSTTTIGKSVPLLIHCNKCGKDKPIADFRPNKSGSLNLCRQCERKR